LRHDGQLQEAAPYLEKALRLRPDSVKALYQAGALNVSLGRLVEALKYLHAAAQKSPEFQQVHVQLASVYQRLHRIEDSRRERQIVLKLDEKARQNQHKPVQ
jgi:tetratricopeptide (TPR) repeat protein